MRDKKFLCCDIVIEDKYLQEAYGVSNHLFVPERSPIFLTVVKKHPFVEFTGSVPLLKEYL